VFPTSETTRAKPQQRKVELWAKNCREFYRKWRLPHHFWVLLHAVNLRYGTDGFTSPPKEGVLRIFSPDKFRRLRPSLNPRTHVNNKPFFFNYGCTFQMYSYWSFEDLKKKNWTLRIISVHNVDVNCSMRHQSFHSIVSEEKSLPWRYTVPTRRNSPANFDIDAKARHVFKLK